MTTPTPAELIEMLEDWFGTDELRLFENAAAPPAAHKGEG